MSYWIDKDSVYRALSYIEESPKSTQFFAKAASSDFNNSKNLFDQFIRVKAKNSKNQSEYGRAPSSANIRRLGSMRESHRFTDAKEEKLLLKQYLWDDNRY